MQTNRFIQFLYVFYLFMNNTNYIENQNKGKLPLGRNGQVGKDPM
jgi:hypothetical protein